MNKYWNTGRGRKSPYCDDVFLMVLTVLKHGGTWAFLATHFRIQPSSFEKNVSKFVNLINEEIIVQCMDLVLCRYHMKFFFERGLRFGNFPEALYATDVTCQQAIRPNCSMTEAKPYFSPKHKLYGYKTEVSVLPNGMSCFLSDHYFGSIPEVTILRHNIELHSNMTATREWEKENMHLHAKEEEKDESNWAFLADKAHIGGSDELRLILPKRNPQRKILDLRSKEPNVAISHDRIIVENYFGRMKAIWGLLSMNYTWEEDIYDTLMTLGVAITNYNIHIRPLRAEDRVHMFGSKTA